MMRSLWQTIYSLVVLPPLWVALHIAGLLRDKVRRGIRGRQGLFQDLERRLRSVGAGPRVWFHSSSMGEFEQARPIIAMLKERRPEVRIIVTFFSPSGYEHTQNYPLADLISYLPFDTRNNAARFLDLIRPDAAVMVRYDIWPNHIWELRRRTIPIMIANATMRRQTARRIPLIRSFHRSVYGSMTHILTASEADADTFTLFRLDGPTIEAIGDTRFDQVTTRSDQARQRTMIPPELIRKKKVFVVGSSWPEDDAVVLPSFLTLAAELPELLMVLVPHEPTPRHLEELEEQLSGKISVLRFSALDAYAGQRVLLVDSVGILMSLYASSWRPLSTAFRFCSDPATGTRASRSSCWTTAGHSWSRTAPSSRARWGTSLPMSRHGTSRGGGLKSTCAHAREQRRGSSSASSRA
jgi:3-deoxy-D-manno-octulosonic-acid transferase